MHPPYEKLALRTNAPVDAARSRLSINALCLLHQTASSTLLAALDADNLKRHLFYGKGEIPIFAESYVACLVEKLKANGRNSPFTDQEINLLHSALGQVTESAEFLESVIETLLEGKPLDKVNLAEEIGDSQWYHAIAADALGTTFDIIQDLNIKKLQKRYPEKFCEEKAVNRDLDTERRTLEAVSAT